MSMATDTVGMLSTLQPHPHRPFRLRDSACGCALPRTAQSVVHRRPRVHFCTASFVGHGDRMQVMGLAGLAGEPSIPPRRTLPRSRFNPSRHSLSL